jgi:hypothetical protein
MTPFWAYGRRSFQTEVQELRRLGSVESVFLDPGWFIFPDIPYSCRLINAMMYMMNRVIIFLEINLATTYG